MQSFRMSTAEIAKKVRENSQALMRLSDDVRAALIKQMADVLSANREEILRANEKDMAAAEELLEKGELSSAAFRRLRLSDGKIDVLCDGLRQIAEQPDPIGRVLHSRQLGQGVRLKQVTSPLGVLLVIFESRPDALPQIAALALRAGNALILKGGKEASASNRKIHELLLNAFPSELSKHVLTLVDTREDVKELLACSDSIDLVIPRGSNKMVSTIQRSTKIPVLGHADGICHVYIHPNADVDMAAKLVADSKTNYPAACNAVETLLFDAELPKDFVAKVIASMPDVSFFAAPGQGEVFDLPEAESLRHEWGEKKLTLCQVKGIDQAIAHIHRFGSGHTDVIVTEDEKAASHFLASVDSASVFHNLSTRFADGYRYGLGAEVGISTSRIHARGPVGIEGLVTTRWLAEGSGQTVADVESGAWKFDWKEIAN